MPANVSLKPSARFDFKLPNEWPQSRRRHQQYLTARGLDKENDAQKVGTMLYCLGEESDDVLTSTNISEHERENWNSTNQDLSQKQQKGNPMKLHCQEFRCPGEQEFRKTTVCPSGTLPPDIPQIWNGRFCTLILLPLKNVSNFSITASSFSRSCSEIFVEVSTSSLSSPKQYNIVPTF